MAATVFARSRRPMQGADGRYLLFTHSWAGERQVRSAAEPFDVLRAQREGGQRSQLLLEGQTGFHLPKARAKPGAPGSGSSYG